jgi:hypothetical protein
LNGDLENKEENIFELGEETSIQRLHTNMGRVLPFIEGNK